ncbi:MAG: TetR/AcrR family transcriptional regulator [Bacteroidota bacterium]
MATLIEETKSPIRTAKSQTKRKPGRPTADAEINIENLCDVAVNVFAEKGYSGTTTTEITRKAGVARSLIHYYFGNKEELWKASIKRLANEFISEFERSKKIHKDLDGLQMIKVVVRQLVHFYAKYPAFPKIIAQEMSERSERSQWIIDSLIYPLFNVTGELFKKQRKLGNLKRIDKEFQTSILLGMASNFFANPFLVHHLYEKDPFADEMIEGYADAVVEVFCHGMMTPPAAR